MKRRRVRVGNDDLADEDGKMEVKKTEWTAPDSKGDPYSLESDVKPSQPLKRQQTLDFLSIFRKGEEDEDDEVIEEEEEQKEQGDDEEEEEECSSSDEEIQFLRESQKKTKKTKFVVLFYTYFVYLDDF